MTTTDAEVARPVPGARVFERERVVRISEVGAGGCLRLDALADYLQQVAEDDAADAVVVLDGPTSVDPDAPTPAAAGALA